MSDEQKIAGIDYSLSSPAITLFDNEQYHFFFFVRSESKKPDLTKIPFSFNLHATIFEKQFNSYLDKYKYLSDWSIDILKYYNINSVTIEDYSFGSTGSRLFQIAENTSILKYRMMFELGITINNIAPKMVKKLSTGNGNANKEQMELSFIQKTAFDIRTVLHQTTKQMNPSSDIIDSYFIYQYGVNKKIA